MNLGRSSYAWATELHQNIVFDEKTGEVDTVETITAMAHKIDGQQQLIEEQQSQLEGLEESLYALYKTVIRLDEEMNGLLCPPVLVRSDAHLS